MPRERIGQDERLQRAGTISMYRAVTRNIKVVVKLAVGRRPLGAGE